MQFTQERFATIFDAVAAMFSTDGQNSEFEIIFRIFAGFDVTSVNCAILLSQAPETRIEIFETMIESNEGRCSESTCPTLSGDCSESQDRARLGCIYLHGCTWVHTNDNDFYFDKDKAGSEEDIKHHVKT